MVADERHRQMMRLGFLTTLITLAVQFMLGMGVNLFVQIPHDHPGANPPEYFSGVAQSVTWAILHGHILLTLHAVLGLLLVLGGFGLIVRAIVSRSRSLIIATAAGALGVLGAGFNGGSFLNYHEDFSSMLMATGFAIAAVSYEVGLFLTARPASPSSL